MAARFTTNSCQGGESFGRYPLQYDSATEGDYTAPKAGTAACQAGALARPCLGLGTLSRLATGNVARRADCARRSRSVAARSSPGDYIPEIAVRISSCSYAGSLQLWTWRTILMTCTRSEIERSIALRFTPSPFDIRLLFSFCDTIRLWGNGVP
jgi:hypothetical protein